MRKTLFGEVMIMRAKSFHEKVVTFLNIHKKNEINFFLTKFIASSIMFVPLYSLCTEKVSNSSKTGKITFPRWKAEVQEYYRAREAESVELRYREFKLTSSHKTTNATWKQFRS